MSEEKHMRSTQLRGLIAAFSVATVLTVGSLVSVSAQKSPDTLQANIFAGTCAQLAEAPLQALNNVTNNDPRVNGSFSGTASAFGVLTSETEVRIRLSDMTAAPHAIVISDGTSNVACGDIGGITSRTSRDFRIGIAPIGDSGVFGIAELEDDDNETEIDLYIAAVHRS
jgi:hypothetical protein